MRGFWTFFDIKILFIFSLYGSGGLALGSHFEGVWRTIEHGVSVGMWLLMDCVGRSGDYVKRFV